MIYMQPVLSAHQRMITGVEALARVVLPEREVTDSETLFRQAAAEDAGDRHHLEPGNLSRTIGTYFGDADNHLLYVLCIDVLADA